MLFYLEYSHADESDAFDSNTDEVTGFFIFVCSLRSTFVYWSMNDGLSLLGELTHPVVCS